MRYGYREYEEIKKLLDKYQLEFKSVKDYELFIKDLIGILKL